MIDINVLDIFLFKINVASHSFYQTIFCKKENFAKLYFFVSLYFTVREKELELVCPPKDHMKVAMGFFDQKDKRGPPTPLIFVKKHQFENGLT